MFKYTKKIYNIDGQRKCLKIGCVQNAQVCNTHKEMRWL